MDDQDEDWENEEQTACEYLEGRGGCKFNVRWILEKGVNLGKKAVITGFVMSSAPVVLPPIFVVSAVGLAFSVPFGLVFTGYACTQKLMSSLLPMPIETPMLEYDKTFYDEMGEMDWRGEGKDRIDMENEEKELMDYVRGGVEERIELVKNENEVPQADEEYAKSRGLKEEGYEEDDDEPLVDLLRKEDALDSSGRKNFREEEGEWGVTELTVEGGGDMGREEINLKIEETLPVRKDNKYDGVKPQGDRVVSIVSGERSGTTAIGKKENTEEEDIRRGSVGLLELIKAEGNADDASKKTKKTRNKNKKTTSKGSAEMPLPEVKDKSGISKNQPRGPEKRQKPEDSNEVGMQQHPVGGLAGSAKLIPSQKNITGYPPEATDGDNNSSEVNEERIWEQIDSLRTIVGYKETPHRSSIEEVKALYIFAGVELPSSFGDQPDLAELSNKLRFLMSVVGVK